MLGYISAALLALGWLAMLPASARAESENASLGQVTAALSYQVVHHAEEGYEWSQVFKPELTITRSGAQVFDASLSSKPPCEPLEETGAAGCSPLKLGLGSPSVQVVDIESDGEPDVVVHVWTGGAHCCQIDYVYRWSPATASYELVEHNWENPPTSIVDLWHDGQLQFLTSNQRFAYAFTSYAFSGRPVQVFVFRNGTFHDVTRNYPALIAAESRKQWRAYRLYTRQATGLGYLAAWAADEYLLGKRGRVRRALERENRLGHLQESTLHGAVNLGSRYVAKLKRFLRKNGYN